MSEYLFVCGTLRPALASGEMKGLVDGLSNLGEGMLPGCLYDLGEYPGAVPDPRSESRIVGEVLDLPGDQRFLARLDDYEGIDPNDPDSGLFVRVKCEVTLADGRKLDCWVYRYNQQTSSMTQIPNGDYLLWLQKQKR